MVYLNTWSSRLGKSHANGSWHQQLCCCWYRYFYYLKKKIVQSNWLVLVILVESVYNFFISVFQISKIDTGNLDPFFMKSHETTSYFSNTGSKRNFKKRTQLKMTVLAFRVLILSSLNIIVRTVEKKIKLNAMLK